MKRGVTLLEMLVAVILSGIVTFIAFGIIKGEQKNYTKTRAKIRLQSDAREGMRILEEEIKNAGYRTSAIIDPTSKELTTESCKQALYPTSDASFDPTPPAAIYGGQAGLEIRFYAPSSSNPSVNCVDDLWTVGYKYDAKAKTLYRQAKRGDPLVNKLNATDWVPFLEGVSAFSTEYGALHGNDSLFTAPASMATVDANDWYFVEPDYVFEFAQSKNGTWVVQNIISKEMTLVFKKYPLTSSGNAAQGARSEPLDDSARYRFSFDVSASENFFDDATGLPSSPVGDPSTLVKCGFFKADGTPVSTFTFRPVNNGVVHSVVYDLVPAASSNEKLFFGMRFKLKAVPPNLCVPTWWGGCTFDMSKVRTMTINSLNITRLNNGKYDFTATVPKDLKTVQALRMQMTVISKNETLKFDRIIPMVNNGL